MSRLDAHVDGAKLISEMLEELRACQRDNADCLLNLTQAAKVSGYSADHLGRLVRDGTLVNHGRPHAPRIRRGDLPQRPAARAAACNDGAPAYDPATDARTLWSRPNKGGSSDG